MEPKQGGVSAADARPTATILCPGSGERAAYAPRSEHYLNNPLLHAAVQAGLREEQVIDLLADRCAELQRMVERLAMLQPGPALFLAEPPRRDPPAPRGFIAGARVRAAAAQPRDPAELAYVAAGLAEAAREGGDGG